MHLLCIAPTLQPPTSLLLPVKDQAETHCNRHTFLMAISPSPAEITGCH
jgi:hypothetical protein